MANLEMSGICRGCLFTKLTLTPPESPDDMHVAATRILMQARHSRAVFLQGTTCKQMLPQPIRGVVGGAMLILHLQQHACH